MKIKNNVILITGGTSGIGLGLAEEVLKEAMGGFANNILETTVGNAKNLREKMSSYCI